MRFPRTVFLVCLLSSGLWATPITEIASIGGTSGDLFGWSIAVLGNTAVVGAPRQGSTPETGAAYIFQNLGNGWTQIAWLHPSDRGNDNFGVSVAITDSTIVVSASNSGKHHEGALYVFVKPPGGWADMTETAVLMDSHNNDSLGSHVAISASGNRIAACANYAALVFVQPGGAWTNLTRANAVLVPPAGVVSFGSAVALNGNIAVVSANVGEDGVSGAAYVYDLRQRTQGSRLIKRIATLSATDGNPLSDYWTSLAMSADTVLVGAPNHNTSGAAYVFVKPQSGWTDMTQTAELSLAGESSAIQFAQSVSTSGTSVVVGTPAALVGSNLSQGEAFIYDRPPAGWMDSTTPDMTITATDGLANDALGASVAISGKTVFVGAPFHTINGNKSQGVVYVLSAP
jgi:hypothetical protein